MPPSHGVDGLALTAIPAGDRIEILTEAEHWIIDKLSTTAYWLSLMNSGAGTSRITPLGSFANGLLATDWLEEGSEFRFRNHRTEADEAIPVKLLVWKRSYHLAPEALDEFPKEP